MKKVIPLLFGIAISTQVLASTYEVELQKYQVVNGKLDINKHAPIAGYMDRYYSSYNDSTQRLKTSITLLDKRPSQVASDFPEYDPKGIGKGFWQVITTGTGPSRENSNAQYALLVGDARTKKVTSYVYEFSDNTLFGINLIDSRPDLFIQSFDNAFQVDDSDLSAVTYSFDIDVSEINSHASGDWIGVQYAETIGIWAHPFFIDGPDSLTYNADGSISNLDIAIEGWFDTPMEPSSDEFLRTSLVAPDPVPVPAAIWLFATGLFGFTTLRKYNKI